MNFNNQSAVLNQRRYQSGTRAPTCQRIDALRLNFKPAETVLDLGCNIGEFCDQLNKNGIIATGVDQSPPLKPGFLRADINQGMPALFETIGIERFDHLLVLSIWKYIKLDVMVDVISYYTKKSVTIEFNPRIQLERQKIQKIFGRSSLEVEDMWTTNDRFHRHVVRLVNRQLSDETPPHIVQNEKTGTAARYEPQLILTLNDVRSGRVDIAPGTVVMMRRKELLKVRKNRVHPLRSWWVDPWMGRRLTGIEKMAWLKRSCKDGWDWKRPAHLSFSKSGNLIKLVNGTHRLAVSEGEFIPVLISYIP